MADQQLKPEEKARVYIDRQLQKAGWRIVDRDEYEASTEAQAVRETLTKGHKEADYMLFLNDVAIGVIEAKRDDIKLDTTSHMSQVEYYATHPEKWYKCFGDTLPFVWLANGKQILFRDRRDADSIFEERGEFPSPKFMARLLDMQDEWVALPDLPRKGLRECQFEAISNLETSFREGERRALIVLATGAGKTYTACTACYRLLTYTPMKRILFLVDRNNLGRQAEEAFGMYRLTENGEVFNTIYGVERLRNRKIPQDAQVIIATIQGLYAYLRGEQLVEDDSDENSLSAQLSSFGDKAFNIPHDFFDLIIIDECHRSIYSSWQQVLNYFDTARLIGLTATPVPETLAFFNRNVVMNYTLERSIVDGVNVDYRVYRIKTKASEDGGTIAAEEHLNQFTRYTGAEERIRQQAEQVYTASELNRSVINPQQIRTILTAYRDSVYTDLYPDRTDTDWESLPKTLIYALNDAHASLIVDIAREVFYKQCQPEFVQKITYSAGDSNQLIKDFRNTREFRIAVTVTLVATGTDVKPLEVVMFMRDVASDPLYQQMVGRGVRTVGDDQLRSVTPNAFSKDHFYLVDAVGVTEHSKMIPKVTLEPGADNPSFEQLLEEIAHGKVDDRNLRLLASRLARIANKYGEPEQKHFFELAGCVIMEISRQIYEAMEVDSLPPYTDIGAPNTERLQLVAPLRNHAKARKYLLILNAGFIKILDPGDDQLISTGFSLDEARDTTQAFEHYIQVHHDEVEALRILFNHEGEPITRLMLEDLRLKLMEYNHHFEANSLWHSYQLLQHDKVVMLATHDEKSALTNLIQLVRFALGQTDRLQPISSYANRLFNLWWGKRRSELSDAQVRLFEQVKDYVVSNGAADIKAITSYNKQTAVQLIMSFKTNRQLANDYIESLSNFIINSNYATA